MATRTRESRPAAAFPSPTALAALLLTLTALATVPAAAAPAIAQEAADPGPREAVLQPWDLAPAVAPEEVGCGELLWRTGRGLVPLPVLDLEVDVLVTGILVRGTVIQRFHNPTDEVIEAVYVFPLPERAAVQHMELRVGERRIVSRVEERQRARRVYEEARDTGRKAGLVEQERPDLFTTSVANINPDEEVAVELRFVDEVVFRDGEFGYDFPLTFTPRFVPTGALAREAAAREGTSAAPLVPDAERITPPFVAQDDPRVPRARVRARLETGFPLADVASPSHAVAVERDAGGVTLRPAAGPVLADRDLRLRWRPEAAPEPRRVQFTEEREDGRYAAVLVVPAPGADDPAPGLPTETFFVIDVSGSMDGPSIEVARLALQAALDRLRPEDRFNVLAFNVNRRLWSGDFADATTRAVASARQWVGRLRADGGTMLHPALVRALAGFTAAESDLVRRVVLITDAAVGNEAQLLGEVAWGLGPVRLHVLGIGHAPNRHLVRKLAEAGRGRWDFVADLARDAGAVDRFLTGIDRPVLSDLELRWSGRGEPEVHPRRLPDLHLGQTLLVTARLPQDDPDGGFVLEGRLRGRTVHQEVPVAAAQAASGVAVRWARSRVGDLMDALAAGGDEDAIRADVVDLGRRFHLVTRYTSLVAVEDVPTAVGPARTAPVPDGLPAGSRLLVAGGVLPRGGTDAPLRRLLGLVLSVAGLAGCLLLKRGRS